MQVRFITNYFEFKYVFKYFPILLSVLHITLLEVILGVVIGLFLGIILTLVRIYKIPVLSQLAIVYISFIRGTPIIVQLYLVNYGLPIILTKLFNIDTREWDLLIFVILTLGLNSAAFLAEIIRVSILSVPIGQTEAAYSIGLTRLQTFSRIISPQALVVALPSLGTEMVGLLQGTAIAYMLGVIDVMGRISTLAALYYHSLEGYVDAAVIFIILSFLVERLFFVIQNKISYK